MADIFVSYARADKARVAPLVAALEANGWSVWWDPEITPGQEFDDLIRRELGAAGAVIVVWTPASVGSRWVRGEARLGAERGVLVPVRFDAAQLPIDALSLHTTDLDGWKEDAVSRPFQELARAIKALLMGSSGRGDGARPAAATSDLSLAVLPFVNMSSDPEQEYFSDGLTEELLNQLAQLKELRVIGRTSCFAFKGKNEDLRLIGQKLDVAHILEGSVRKAGNRLRITAQLVKCADHAHLWSQTYDRDLDDVFAIQDDVARAVADALKITLGLGEETQSPGGTRNVEAYDNYLRAAAIMQNGGLMTTDRAADMLRGAVTLDPNFAKAWLSLGQALSIKLTFGVDDALVEERDQALDRVVALAPGLWTAHIARAARLLGQRQWMAADQAYARAVELGPRPFPEAGSYTTFLGAVGRVSESIPYFRAAREADPFRPLPTLQMFLTIAGRYAEADAEYARTREIAAGPLQLADWFAFSQTLATEDRAEARRRLESLIPHAPNEIVFNEELLAVFDDDEAALDWVRDKLADPSPETQSVGILFGFLAAYFGAPEEVLPVFRKTFVEAGQFIPLVNIWHPVFAGVRKLSGFKTLVRDLGIADYWRESRHWGDFARPVGDDDFEIVR